MAAGQRARIHYTLEVVGQKGTADVEVRGSALSLTDAKRQTVRVVPPGFPVAESYAGRIHGQQEVTIDVPQSVIPDTLEVTLSAYPSTIATLQSGLEGILREPSGCFEQASSSNYPNLLLMQYLDEHKVVQPEIARRGKKFLASGYAKLTGYECKNRGFEWFGADPGHEALTAYGLMEFRDMARVHQVDRSLIDRTAEWLLARRDGKGGFQRNSKQLDGFGGAPDTITNAYIVWALSEAGESDIDRELSQVIERHTAPKIRTSWRLPPHRPSTPSAMVTGKNCWASSRRCKTQQASSPPPTARSRAAGDRRWRLKPPRLPRWPG